MNGDVRYVSGGIQMFYAGEWIDYPDDGGEIVWNGKILGSKEVYWSILKTR